MTRAGQSAVARWGPRAWKTALVLAVGAGGLWTATHGVAGARWSDIVQVLRGVAPRQLGLLAAIWLGGLGIYSLVLSAALPGLGVRRSLLLNLSGSAVANVVPLGGAVATAVNWRMVRTWGHSDRAFVAYCLLTNVLDVMSKLVLPVVAVAALVAVSTHVPAVLWAVTGGCAAALLAALGVLATSTRHRTGSRGASGRWSAVVREHLRDSGARVRALLAGSWRQLVPASLGYVAAQVVLLVVALRSVGLDAPLTVVLTAAAIERIGTLVPLTPAGTGIAELGPIAWLVAAGLDPAEVVAGVLLYRVFLVALEVPIGGVLLGGWAWVHPGTRSRRAGDVAA